MLTSPAAAPTRSPQPELLSKPAKTKFRSDHELWHKQVIFEAIKGNPGEPARDAGIFPACMR
ncbi:MAG: hypothetical protein DMG32_09745 [Acidobacteria bacterium]|nr:MAG: hypothetical protein DMG32_09745 [Acidobacteriota bacterium]